MVRASCCVRRLGRSLLKCILKGNSFNVVKHQPIWKETEWEIAFWIKRFWKVAFSRNCARNGLLEWKFLESNLSKQNRIKNHFLDSLWEIPKIIFIIAPSQAIAAKPPSTRKFQIPDQLPKTHPQAPKPKNLQQKTCQNYMAVFAWRLALLPCFRLLFCSLCLCSLACLLFCVRPTARPSFRPSFLCKWFPSALPDLSTWFLPPLKRAQRSVPFFRPSFFPPVGPTAVPLLPSAF